MICQQGEKTVDEHTYNNMKTDIATTVKLVLSAYFPLGRTCGIRANLMGMFHLT